MFAAKQPHGGKHAQKTAVKRHTAFPYFENIQRMIDIGREFVKQHITQPAADNDAKDAPSQEVVEHFAREQCIALRDAAAAQPQKQHKADDVAQGIPADGERADAD